MKEYAGVLVKDPSDVSDTGINWNAKNFLTARSTTITASTWPSFPAGLTNVATTSTTTTTTIRVSGGTVNTDYELVNHVTLANGEEYDRTILVQVRQR